MSGTDDSPEVDEDDRWRGQTLGGRYTLRRKIGRGAMGTVFEAEHVRLHKRVAIKMLHPNLQLDEQSMRRFQQEGVAAGRLRHPGVVQVFDFDRAESGSFYLAMEFVDGVTLRERMKQGPMDPAAAVALARAVLEVLAAAHREGVVHRDLKPENVLVVEAPPDPPQVKLLDFGISKLMDLHNENTALTHTGQVLGTPLYMAPEQWTGEPVDARADLYALAAILFEMVAGAPLFQGRSLTELLSQHTQEMPPLLSERCHGRQVPRDLERVLARALVKPPSHRFADAGEMSQALARIDWQRVAGRGWIARGARAVRRRPFAAAAGLLVALAIGAGIWFLAPRGGDAASKAQPSRVRLATRSKESLTPDERLDLAALERAREDVDRGDARAVLASLRDLLQRPDPDAEAFLLRGQAYALLRDPETARKDLEHVLALEGDWPQAYCALARLDLDVGRIESARTGFERARAADPRCAPAWLGLAEIALYEELLPSALSAAATARELDPADPRALLILGQASLRSGDLDGAGDHLIEAKRRQPGSAAVHLELARLYTARSDLVQAERELREARSLDPANVAATLELSALLLGREQYFDARFLLVDALSLGNDSADLRAALALAHDGGGDRDSAIHEMRRALQRGGSGGAGRWSLLGSWLSERGDFDAAIDAFLSALIVDEEHAPAHRELGALYLRLERFDEAREQLLRSIELAEDREAFFLLGVLEWEYAGDHEAALHAFERYRQLGGVHPRVQMELDRVRR